MREITHTQGTIFHIIAEPGDATRYDFYLTQLGSNICCIDPHRLKIIDYPNVIYGSYLDIKTSTTREFDSQLYRLADTLKVNVNTLNQVLIAVSVCFPHLKEIKQ